VKNYLNMHNIETMKDGNMKEKDRSNVGGQAGNKNACLKDPKERANCQFTVYCSEKQLEIYKQKAEDKGDTLSGLANKGLRAL